MKILCVRAHIHVHVHACVCCKPVMFLHIRGFCKTQSMTDRPSVNLYNKQKYPFFTKVWLHSM